MLRWVFITLISVGLHPLLCQSFFTAADTLNKNRVFASLAITSVTSTTFAIGLYNTWYKKFETGPFHFFNDLNEWNQMDKAGHIHTAYFQSLLCYKGARWTGMSKKSSIWTGFLSGMIFQTTVEVFDGFSSKWGFSFPDMMANISGGGIFALQQHYWNDQRISIKISSIPKEYSNSALKSDDGSSFTTLQKRSQNLFGNNFFERYLKDYNAQTYWASLNVYSFLGENNVWPKWLNLAVGFGSENLYGGFENSWTENNKSYTLKNDAFPRYRQFYLSFDIDFTKLKSKSPFIKTLFSGLNIFKVPAPALEINTEGRIVFHLLR